MPNSRLNVVEPTVEPFVMGVGGPTGSARPQSVKKPLGSILGEDHRGVVEPCLVNMKGQSTARSIDDPTFSQTAKQHQYLVEPVLMNLKGKKRRARSVNSPAFSQCAGGNHQALVDGEIAPFTMSAGGPELGPKAVDDGPLRTVLTRDHQALVESELTPFIAPVNHGAGDMRTHDVGKPMPAVTAFDAWGLIEAAMLAPEPFVMKLSHTKSKGDYTYSPDRPLTTITGLQEHALVEPHLIAYHGDHKGRKDGSKRSRSLKEPLPAQDGSNRFGLVEGNAFLTKSYKGSDAAPTSEPLPSVTANFEHLALAQPYLIKFYGTTEDGQPITTPLGSVTGKDRFGLVIPQLGVILDIKFRMLQPHELAAAMSFPKNYTFAGTREDKVMQIGNAVPGETATALCKALLSDQAVTRAPRPKLKRAA